VVAEGTLEEIIKNENSITGPFLSKHISIQVDRKQRIINKFLEIV
jgi:excinuclease UvrABC ATPase subunit